MVSTFFGLETARRGMNVHRTALDTTGHNIANASTEGYTRQQAVIKSSDPYAQPNINSSATPGQLGTGVEVTEMRRIRDGFLDNQVRDSANAQGYWESRSDMATRIETIFPEPDGRGIQDVMLNFFKDWHSLNNTPQDPGLKKAVAETAQELTALFRQTYKQQENISESIAVYDKTNGSNEITEGRIADHVKEVNDIAIQINDLNKSIEKVIAVGQQPNDLLDKRDLLLDKLAEFGTVKTTPQDDGAVTVEFYGEQLVDGNNHNAAKITAYMDVTGPDADGYNNTELSLKFDNGGSVTSGEMQGYVDKAEGSIAGLESSRQRVMQVQQDLDILAYSLAEEVNKLHPDDTTNGYKKIFDIESTTPIAGYAKEFVVNSDVIKNPTTAIDGTKALDIARLRSEPISALDDATFEAHYQKILAETGAFTKSSDEMLANQKAIRENIDAVKESVSGVSIDEELTNMIQYQHGFQASSRMVSVINDMLDVVINRLF